MGMEEMIETTDKMLLRFLQLDLQNVRYDV